MPYLLKAASQHHCTTPGVFDGRNGAQRGDIWQCDRCERIYRLEMMSYGLKWWPISEKKAQRLIARNGGDA